MRNNGKSEGEEMGEHSRVCKGDKPWADPFIRSGLPVGGAGGGGSVGWSHQRQVGGAPFLSLSSHLVGLRLFTLRHHGDELQYQVATPTSDPAKDRQILVDYFRLDFDLSSLYLK